MGEYNRIYSIVVLASIKNAVVVRKKRSSSEIKLVVHIVTCQTCSDSTTTGTRSVLSIVYSLSPESHSLDILSPSFSFTPGRTFHDGRFSRLTPLVHQPRRRRLLPRRHQVRPPKTVPINPQHKHAPVKATTYRGCLLGLPDTPFIRTRRYSPDFSLKHHLIRYIGRNPQLPQHTGLTGRQPG